MKNILKLFQTLSVIFFITLIAACSHPISISPIDKFDRNNPVSNKNVAYVMTDEQRSQKVTTSGGGGDKVDYQPYRDLEKAIRDGLSSVYKNVIVVSSKNDTKAFIENEISFVFTPIITTTSSSESVFTWPPTNFDIDLNCSVINAAGTEITSFTVKGSGQAEFSEFKSNFGLAGQRAASDLSQKLKERLLSDPSLH